MTKLKWHKVGTNDNGNGKYETLNRKFRIMLNTETGLWQLLQLDSENEYQWCQSYGLLRDAKSGAQWIVNQARTKATYLEIDAMDENGDFADSNLDAYCK